MSNINTLLLVMNDPSDVWTIGQEMIRKGFAVTATTSGRDGFHQLECHQFEYLIIEDSVQEVSLLTFLTHCQRYYPETSTIVLLSSGQVITTETVQLAGANYCIPRPHYLEHISDILSGATTGKTSGEQSVNPGPS